MCHVQPLSIHAGEWLLTATSRRSAHLILLLLNLRLSYGDEASFSRIILSTSLNQLVTTRIEAAQLKEALAERRRLNHIHTEGRMIMNLMS